MQIGGFTFDQNILRDKLARAIILHEYPLSIVDHVAFKDFASILQPLFKIVVTPEPSPTRSASLNRNPGTLGLFLFIFRVIKFSFSKMSRLDPDPTRMADPNQSPVYSDVFIYLIKTFYYVISLRKQFLFWASP